MLVLPRVGQSRAATREDMLREIDDPLTVVLIARGSDEATLRFVRRADRVATLARRVVHLEDPNLLEPGEQSSWFADDGGEPVIQKRDPTETMKKHQDSRRLSIVLLFISLMLQSICLAADPPPPTVEIISFKGKVFLDDEGNPVQEEKATGEARECLVVSVKDDTPSVRKVTIVAPTDRIKQTYIQDADTMKLTPSSLETYSCEDGERQEAIIMFICTEVDHDQITDENDFPENIRFEVHSEDCQRPSESRQSILDLSNKRTRRGEREFSDIVGLTKEVDPDSVRILKTENLIKVSIDEIVVLEGDGLSTIAVSGEIANEEREGVYAIYGDPPGVEAIAIVVVQVADDIPVFNVFGLIALILLLLASGFIVLRPARNATNKCSTV